MEQAIRADTALSPSLRYSLTHWISLLAHPKLVCWMFFSSSSSSCSPPWQDAGVVSLGTAPSHRILAGTAAIGLLALSLHLLIPQTRLLLLTHTLSGFPRCSHFLQTGRRFHLCSLALLSALKQYILTTFSLQNIRRGWGFLSLFSSIRRK